MLIARGKLLNLFEIAGELSEKSDVYYKHGAILKKGGKIIASGCNSNRTRFLKTTISSLHAETATILNFLSSQRTLKTSDKNHRKRGYMIMSGCDLYVARKHTNGTFSNSRPCNKCLKILNLLNIRRVFYTVGTIEGRIYYNVQHIRDMKLTHCCNAEKRIKKYDPLLIEILPNLK